MRLKKSRLSIMGLAALLILFYHIYPIGNQQGTFNGILKFIIRNAFIGVDIFFFCSAYMYKFSRKDSYLAYAKNKLVKLFPLFVISSLLYFFLGNMDIKKTIMTIFGVDLFVSGGGSFLWFLPSLIIVYLLVLPLYERLVKKVGESAGLIIGLVISLGGLYLLEKTSGSHAINIFLARIPIVLLGYTFSGYEGRFKESRKLVAGLGLFALGLAINYYYIYVIKKDLLFTGSFYCISIPLVIGCIMVIDYIRGKLSLRGLEFFGTISLELYCLQMLVGFLIFEKLIGLTGNKILAFAIDFILIVFVAYLVKLARDGIKKMYKRSAKA